MTSATCRHYRGPHDHMRNAAFLRDRFWLRRTLEKARYFMVPARHSGTQHLLSSYDWLSSVVVVHPPLSATCPSVPCLLPASFARRPASFLRRQSSVVFRPCCIGSRLAPADGSASWTGSVNPSRWPAPRSLPCRCEAGLAETRQL